jgi:serine phosphatase RsbU (regulator of sigma subunit)
MVNQNTLPTDSTLEQAWQQEYQRLGSQYAVRAAWMIIFSFPSIIFANYELVNPTNINSFLLVYFAPSVKVGLALLLWRWLKFRHEVMVVVMFFSVFASATYRTNEQEVLIYLIINMVCFIASSVQMLVFPRLNWVFLGYILLINLLASTIFYGETITHYLTNEGGIVVLVLCIVFMGVNQLRYQIIKNNFINSLALKASYQLLEQKSAIIEANALELKEKNKDITDSINYAQRIQKAVFPNEEMVQKVFPQSFVLFLPRDIVSGDFYWLEEQEKTILAAVDCTGHGVPGAFMSLIGNEILNQIVVEKGITSPDLILNELHLGIAKALKKESNQNQDGMDVALISIDKKNQILEFAGAKNPLYYVQNNEMKVIQADKHSVGGFIWLAKPQFKKHKVDISMPTTIYLFSDGFQDQFGGKKGRKFMTTHFRNLLYDIHQEDMSKQKEILLQTLEDWKQGYEQVDDILVIGVKLI